MKDINLLQVEIEELRTENDELRNALLPFANWSSAITIKDINRAKELTVTQKPK